MRTARNGGVRGYDAEKKVKGGKRHLLVDTLGLVLASVVHSSSVQARPALEKLGSPHGWLRKIWADGGYRGKLVKWVFELPRHASHDLEIVARNDKAKGFEVLPLRWIVERTFAWLENSRRLSKDYERTTSSSQATIHIAMTRLMT